MVVYVCVFMYGRDLDGLRTRQGLIYFFFDNFPFFCRSVQKSAQHNEGCYTSNSSWLRMAAEPPGPNMVYSSLLVISGTCGEQSLSGQLVKEQKKKSYLGFMFRSALLGFFVGLFIGEKRGKIQHDCWIDATSLIHSSCSCQYNMLCLLASV